MVGKSPPGNASRTGPALWVDPRDHPDPPLRVAPRPPAPDASGLIELVRLCREGHIYEIERWIRDGKPIQALDYRTSASHHLQTPLQIAIETRQHDLARLLLCNGYRPEEGLETSLDRALDGRAWDIVDLLIAWGADPTKVNPEFVLDTYDSTLIERFWTLGLNYADHHTLADYLATHGRNRPAYGWARRHRDDPAIARELAMSLGEAVEHDKEGPVCLLIWAGADAHMKVPSLMCPQPEVEEEDEDEFSSAIERAISGGKGKFLARLGPDPDRENFEALWDGVLDPDSVDVLGKIKLPSSWNTMIRRNVYWMTVRAWDRRGTSREAIERASTSYGARLSGLGVEGCSVLRRDFLGMTEKSDLHWFLEWLGRPGHCDPEDYAELTRTPSVRTSLVEFGLIRMKPRKKRKKAKRKGRGRSRQSLVPPRTGKLGTGA